MRRKHLYTPYIRRRHRADRAGSFRVAYQMAFHSMVNGGGYVLVQRGSPRLVIAAAANRRELEDSIMWLHINRRYGYRFRHYARATRQMAQGDPMPSSWPPKRYDSGRYGKSLKGKGPAS